MKFWTTLAPMAALLLIVSCGGKKDENPSSSSSAKDGFDSPKALIDDIMETQKKGSLGIVGLMKYISPADRQSMAFQMMMTADMMAAFGEKEEEDKKAVKDLRAKFNVPEKVDGFDEEKPGLYAEDKEKVKEVSAKYFKDVDTSAFLGELYELDHMKKFKEQGDKGPKIKEVKDLKEDGDKATATLVMDNGEEDKNSMVKIDGRWFLNLLDKE
jgi:hypothetical protein